VNISNVVKSSTETECVSPVDQIEYNNLVKRTREIAQEHDTLLPFTTPFQTFQFSKTASITLFFSSFHVRFW